MGSKDSETRPNVKTGVLMLNGLEYERDKGTWDKALKTLCGV